MEKVKEAAEDEARKVEASVVADKTREREREAEAITLVCENHRGEVEARRLIPVAVWRGTDQWHPETTWLIDVYDVDKKAKRTFALEGLLGAPGKQGVRIPTVEDATQYKLPPGPYAGLPPLDRVVQRCSCGRRPATEVQEGGVYMCLLCAEQVRVDLKEIADREAKLWAGKSY
jgi:hypothetical protein